MTNQENTTRRSRRSPKNNTTIGLVDLALMVISFVLAGVIVKGGWNFLPLLNVSEKVGILMSCALGMFFFWCFEMYAVVLLKPGPTVVTGILSAIYTFVCTFLVLFIITYRTDFVPLLLIGTVMSYICLTVWHIALYYYHKNRPHRQKMLMIEKLKDDNSRVRRMKYACMSRFDAWYEQVDIENKESVEKFIESRFPEFDVICLMETVPFDIRNLFMEAGQKMHKDFYIVPMMYEMNFAKVQLAYLDDVMVFHIGPTQMSDVNVLIKRLLDIAVSFVGLAIAFIPMCIIALLIKLTSPGPIFYKQLRLTKNKREFHIYKFRSMVQNAEQLTGPALATKDDPRITPVGKWLRKLRLDELPQLINILKGDMSLVGPRPERPFFVEQYEKEIPNYDYRFTVQAGLTALSHVHGRYSTDVIDRTHYDLLYVQNYSLLLDIRIMLLTSRTMFLSDAAEGVWTVDRREAAKENAKA